MPNYYGDGLCNAISPAQRTNKSSHIATTGPENAMKFTQAACLWRICISTYTTLQVDQFRNTQVFISEMQLYIQYNYLGILVEIYNLQIACSEKRAY